MNSDRLTALPLASHDLENGLLRALRARCRAAKILLRMLHKCLVGVKNGRQAKPNFAQSLVRCTPNSWRAFPALRPAHRLIGLDRIGAAKVTTHGAISLVHEPAAGHSLCTLGSLIRRRVSRDSREAGLRASCRSAPLRTSPPCTAAARFFEQPVD